jgi:hypothetical protein
MAKVVQKLVAVAGVKNNGETSWKQCGVVVEKEGKRFILLDRSFNPAGIPTRDGSDSIMVSMIPYTYPDKKQKSSEYDPEYEYNSDDIPF